MLFDVSSAKGNPIAIPEHDYTLNSVINTVFFIGIDVCYLSKLEQSN